MIHSALADLNPWFQLGGMTPPRAADVSAPPTPWPSAAIQPQGYPCCDDCGTREPCDEHCPAINFQGADAEIAAEFTIHERPVNSHFELDESAFMAEVEPVPAFLTADRRAEQIEALLELARAQDWPVPPVLRRANG